MGLRLVATTAADAPKLQNLLQLYTHDFSEFWAGTPRGDLTASGRFDDYPLDDYWRRPGWSASLIEIDGALAGFVLVNDQAHSGRPVDHSVAEFFVVRKYRGLGLARDAAVAAFARAPGTWEAAIARKNVRALAFWRRTVLNAPEASEIEELDVQAADWDGPILRFRWT